MISYESYIFIYILITIISIIVCTFNIKYTVSNITESRQILLSMILLSLMIAILASVRPEETPDTLTYYYIYSKSASFLDMNDRIIKLGERYQDVEVFYIVLMGTLKEIGFSFRTELLFFAFTNSFLVQYSSYCLGKECFGGNPNFNKIAALFLSLFAYHYSCIAIRAGFSIGMGMLGIVFLIRSGIHNKLVGVLILYIACLSHSMAILFMLPTIILLWKKQVEINYKIYILFTGLLCVASLSMNLGSMTIAYISDIISALFDKFLILGFSNYLNSFDLNVGLKHWLVLMNSLIILYMLTNGKTIKLALIVSMGIYIFSFAYPIRAIHRAADYFLIFLLPMVSALDYGYLSKLQYIYISLFSSVMFLVYQMSL